MKEYPWQQSQSRTIATEQPKHYSKDKKILAAKQGK
jgi:hypothetical protein